MSYLKITNLEIIDTNKPPELFINAGPDGIAVCIRSVALYNDDGTLVRYCDMNKALVDHIKSIHIPLKK